MNHIHTYTKRSRSKHIHHKTYTHIHHKTYTHTHHKTYTHTGHWLRLPTFQNPNLFSKKHDFVIVVSNHETCSHVIAVVTDRLVGISMFFCSKACMMSFDTSDEACLVYVYVCMYMYIYVCICVCMCMCMCMCMCIYVYMYMCSLW